MVATPGQRTSSLNGGELAKEMAGRVDVAVYYSGGLRYKNIEPVPQSGMRLLGGTRHMDDLGPTVVKMKSLDQESRTLQVVVTNGKAEIWNDDALEATIDLPEMTLARVPLIDFYAEANTVGIFVRDMQPIRLFRNDDATWTKDPWPFEKLPQVDLGGVYTKTTDTWEIHLSWTADVSELLLSLSVNGEETPAVKLEVDPPTNHIGTLPNVDWEAFALALQTALRDLPSLSDGVTLTFVEKAASNLAATLEVVFGGDLDGVAYQLDTQVVNTSNAAARPVHSAIGDTEGEDLFSVEQGWFGSVGLVQDRLVYVDINAKPGALAASETAEYFRLNIDSTGDEGARLDALRTQTGERVLRTLEEKYWLAFTDRSVWFATNRTLTRNQPPNFVQAVNIGIMPGTDPVRIEGQLYFVDAKSGAVFSIAYDQISEGYAARPETIYSSHLTGACVRTAKQSGTTENDANRMWIVRSDGRLIMAASIVSQEILGLVEYVLADGGLVKDCNVDGKGRLWLAVQRDGTVMLERMESGLLFQATRTVVADLGGKVTGLDVWNGKQVWAKADGYVIGPLTVSNGSVELGDAYTSVEIGLWQPPVFESMPHVLTMRDDRIVRRPGRIHTVHAHVIDTTSIAIGANGQTPETVVLPVVDNVVGQPPVAFTGKATADGLMGSTEDTTFVITQTRPGTLQVRDIVCEERL